MTTKNPWDSLSQYFDTNKEDLEAGSADNILIAWPVILQFIREYTRENKDLRLLEFGCGTGGFANKLQVMGFNVTGIDSSSKMIEVAKKAHGNSIDFKIGDSTIVPRLGKFDVITSVMALQFIENIDETIKDLSQSLNPRGIFVFAVFNPNYVVDGIKSKKVFMDFDSDTKPTKGITEFSSEIRVSTFIRTASEYNQLARKYGFKPLLEKYPPFPQEFLAKYRQNIPTNHSEYLILGYKR